MLWEYFAPSCFLADIHVPKTADCLYLQRYPVVFSFHYVERYYINRMANLELSVLFFQFTSDNRMQDNISTISQIDPVAPRTSRSSD